MELRRSPERNPFPRAGKHLPRQLGERNQIHRQCPPGRPEQRARRAEEQQGQEPLLFPSAAARPHRPVLPVRQGQARLLAYLPDVLYDGHRDSPLPQPASLSGARARLCLCGFVLLLQRVDRPRGGRDLPVDRGCSQGQGAGGRGRRRDCYVPLRSCDYGGPELGRPRPLEQAHGGGAGRELPQLRGPERLPGHARRQRHLPALVCAGGGGHTHGRPYPEYFAARHGLVHRPDEVRLQRIGPAAALGSAEPVSLRHQRICSDRGQSRL